MKRLFALVGLAVLITSAGCGGQQNPYDYAGSNIYVAHTLVPAEAMELYCSCGPTTSEQSSVPDNIDEASLADGVLVRVAWAEFEPSAGDYRWALIDEQMERAQRHNLKITLAVINGIHAPAWLREEGVEFFDYTSLVSNTPASIPLPWDAQYLSRYADMILALGNRYDGNASLRLVHITHATTNGLEMQYVFDEADRDRFFARGYSEDALIDSWKMVLDSYAFAFSSTPLDVEVHPVFESANVAYRVAEYGLNIMGSRFGVFAAWWSYHNADSVYNDMYNLMSDVAKISFATVQLVAATEQVSTSPPLTKEEFFQALDLASAIGVNYVEIWEKDLFNETLMQAFIQSRNAALARQYAK